MRYLLSLLVALLFGAGIPASLPAQTGITAIMGGAVDAKVPSCAAYAISQLGSVTIPASTAFAPWSLSIDTSRNLWTLSINLTGGSNLDRVYTGTLSPFVLVGTSADINAGGIVGFSRVIADSTNIYEINSGNAASTCGVDCYQYRTVDINANLSASVDTANNPALLNNSPEGIAQSSSEVFISASFGATGAGSAVGRFVKGVGALTFVNGTENAVGSSNKSLVYDGVNGYLYSSHTTAGSNQYARYIASPLAFDSYITSFVAANHGGYAIDTMRNHLLLTAGSGGAVSAYVLQLPGLTGITSALLAGAGDGQTGDVAYNADEDKMFIVNTSRTVLILNPSSLATVTSFTDATATAIFNNVANGMQVDSKSKTMYYIREIADSSLQLAALKYCS